jgi:hypothetical protein
MVAEAKKGVKFVVKVEADESVASTFKALAERAEQLRRMFADVRLGGLDLGAFQTSVDKAHAALDALHQQAAGSIPFAYQPYPVTPIASRQAAPLPELSREAFAERAIAVPAQAAELSAAPTPAGTDVSAPPAPSGQLAPTLTRAPTADPGAYETAIEKVVEEHARAEAEMEAASTRGAARRAAASGRATKVEADEETRAGERRTGDLEKASEAERDYWQTYSEYGRKTMEEQSEAEKKAAEKDAEVVAEITERRKRKLEEATEADRQYRRALAESARKSIESRAGNQEGEGGRRDREQENAPLLQEQAARKAEELNGRLRASFAEAATSAKELTHNLVELGLVSEEDFQKINNAVERVQAVMNLVKNGVQVWRSLHEAVKLYREGIEAAEGAEKALAAVEAVRKGFGAAGVAGTAVEGAAVEGAAAAGAGESAGGLAALGGLVAAINPVTLALGAVAAAALGTVWALNKYTESVSEAERKDREARQKEIEIRELQVAALQKLFVAEQHARQQTNARELLELKISQEFGPKREEYERRARELGLKGDAKEADISRQAAIDQKRRQLEQIEADIAKVKAQPVRSQQAETELPTVDEGRLKEIEHERAKIKLDMREYAENPNPGIDGFGGGFGGDLIANSYLRRLKELDKEESRIRGAASNAEFPTDEQTKVNTDQRLEALTRQRAEVLEQMHVMERDTARERVASLNEQLQKQQELLKGDKERVKSAKEYAEQAHKALTNALVSFAMLSKGQQKRLVRIQEKLDRGEKLTHSELEFGLQHLGSRGKKQAESQAANEVDPRIKDLLFGEETAEANKADQKLSKVVEEEQTHTKQLDQIKQQLQRLAASGELNGGGQKAEYKVEANGHATLEIKWDKASSKLIADAMKPAIEEFSDAIAKMLDVAQKQIKAQFDADVKRAFQRLNQTTAAGA